MIFAISCGDTMQDDRQYLKWCLRQERGIRLVAPSDNLVKAYLEKSHNALKSMEVNAQAKSPSGLCRRATMRSTLPCMLFFQRSV